jgi:hypothetical protein
MKFIYLILIIKNTKNFNLMETSEMVMVIKLNKLD